mgnify:CR=1 FL=1
MKPKVLKGAMLGAGTISYHHQVAWQRIPGVEIVALCNRTIEKAYQRAEEFGIDPSHVYADHEALLDNEELDFVDILTAPAIHLAQVEAAAARGLHIICQKPLATSLEEAQRMIDVCNQAGVLLSVNENWRWRSWYRTVKRMLDEEAIGRVRYVRIAAHYNATHPSPDASERTLFIKQAYTKTMPQLILFEWGVHFIDTLRMLFGEIDWVHAHTDKVSPICAGEDRAFIVLAFGGVLANIDLSWATITGERLPSVLEDVVIEGDEGTIALVPNQGDGDLIRVVNWRGSTLLRPGEQPIGSLYCVTASPAHDGNNAAAYQASYDAAQGHFIECLRAGVDPETVAADNLLTLRAMFACYEAAEKNAVIHLR